MNHCGDVHSGAIRTTMAVASSPDLDTVLLDTMTGWHNSLSMTNPASIAKALGSSLQLQNLTYNCFVSLNANKFTIRSPLL